ncbi:MAG TPA: carbohydrate ABC transporter permease [Candidatus Dormibacteraeota bacterium]|jgi:multiple sugar transport system permease protein|nr:carbohydrate ABC transporter permease [Candidatus Dormibacteraeota bacterium]
MLGSASAPVLGTPRRRRALRRYRNATIAHALLIVMVVLTLIPFAWMLDLAISPPGALALPDPIPHSITLSYFSQAMQATGVARWVLNSAIYSVVSVAASLLLCSMAAYAFAKKRFPGNHVIFWSFVSMLMVPWQLTIVPLYLLIANLNGIDTYWGLILPTVASSQAVFLMRQFILGLPDELFEAAKLDGASELVVFRRIVLPLCVPIMATLGIFIFLFHWNDFFWPLLAAQSENMQTLTVGLATFQARSPNVGELMASTIIGFIPSLVVFMLLQRYIVRSIALSGLTGR